MYAAAPVVALLSLLTVTWAAPVTYDQRQEGEWNVHAHLDNFVIILIPSSNAANLLDATKLNPFKTQLRHVFKAATQGQQPAEATQPRVADSSVKANDLPLMKLHPSESSQAVMMAESSAVALHTSSNEPLKQEANKKEEAPTVPVISASALKEDKQASGESVSSRAKALAMPCPQGESRSAEGDCQTINRRSQRILSVLQQE